ncbi:hypothetical protein BOKEGFJH_00022 [Chlamydia avium]|uniref:Uncharacterized protein n=1 Tax=Chlamydia avium TaxID=1457141 RepID=A0ABP2X7Q3_9CHLA|nr:hypothetical protein [Chlamydia avium]EPP37749.1 hypothetical protein CP10743SC13_0336 [Chlamydia psittaci 10_743_SC13]EPP38836.1 hypothetical protein CP10881SC42_0423 [Chlamydia avium]VVT42515.1 hypothetical protein BOKEGFJH_00022 [Chlamydia avium]
MNSYAVAYPWAPPKSLTILGSPFIDIILDTTREFIESCGLIVGENQPVTHTEIKRIFLMYKESFPTNCILATRKEPLSLTEEQLENLGISSHRNEQHHNYLEYTEYGPALNELDQMRLILRCTDQEDTICYSVKKARENMQRARELLEESTECILIDSELFLCEYDIENFLTKAKEMGNKILLDLINPTIALEFRERIWSWLSYVDVLFLSKNSIQTLTGLPNILWGKQFLSRIVPVIFIQEESQVCVAQHGEEIVYSTPNNPQETMLNFLFVYINNPMDNGSISCGSPSSDSSKFVTFSLRKENIN